MSSHLLTYVLVILAPPENSSMLYSHIHSKTDNDYIQAKLHLLILAATNKKQTMSLHSFNYS